MNKRSVSLQLILLKAFDCPNVRLEKQLTPYVRNHWTESNAIYTEGRTSLLFQTFLRVVEVLSMVKAERFLYHVRNGVSVTLHN